MTLQKVTDCDKLKMVRWSSCIFPASCLMLRSRPPSNISRLTAPVFTLLCHRLFPYAPPLSPHASQNVEENRPDVNGTRTPALFPPRRSTGVRLRLRPLWFSQIIKPSCPLHPGQTRELLGNQWVGGGWGASSEGSSCSTTTRPQVPGVRSHIKSLKVNTRRAAGSGEPSVFARGVCFNFSPSNNRSRLRQHVRHDATERRVEAAALRRSLGNQQKSHLLK